MNVLTKFAHSRNAGSRLAAAVVACGMLTGLATSPAAASTLPVELETPARAGAGNAGEVEVHGREVAAANDPISMTLPGRATAGEVDLTLVPEGAFRGEGAAALSTTIAGAIISTYGTAEGAQTLIEIPSLDSPTEYRFPLEMPKGGEAVLLEDGSVAIFAANGDPLGGFHTPWAYDANGIRVPTSFRIEGDTLVQTVELTSATAFPVIADPDRGTAWWGVWTRYTKAETRSLAGAIRRSNAAMVKDYMTAACAFAPGWTGAACGMFVQAKWYTVMQPALDAAARGKCFALNIPRFVPGVTMNGTIVTCTR